MSASILGEVEKAIKDLEQAILNDPLVTIEKIKWDIADLLNQKYLVRAFSNSVPGTQERCSREPVCECLF